MVTDLFSSVTHGVSSSEVDAKSSSSGAEQEHKDVGSVEHRGKQPLTRLWKR